MGRITSITAACCAAALLTAAPLAAQPANKLTYVTFSAPVSLPGTTLPAGTYAFRLAESPANRHIVQVFNRDETKLLTTLLAVPAERNEAEGDPVVAFKETPSDRPPAVRYWYYAGEKAGNEFVYPKTQAMTIARASGESVMSVDTDSTSIEDWKTSTPTRITATADPSATSTASTASTGTSTATSTATTTAEPAQTPTPAPTTGTGTSTATTGSMTTGTATTGSMTTGSTATGTATSTATTTGSATAAEPAPATVPTTTAPTMTEPAPTPQTAAPPMVSAPSAQPEPVGTSGRAEPSELPRTASHMPAVGLIGLLALGGALVLRVARRSMA